MSDSIFTHFDDDEFGVLFFSRGHGRGHAMPDIRIADAVLNEFPDVRIRFASYSSGAQTLQASAHGTIDLQLPDNPAPLELMARQTRLIASIQPRLVIAHEGIPCAAGGLYLRHPVYSHH